MRSLRGAGAGPLLHTFVPHFNPTSSQIYAMYAGLFLMVIGRLPFNSASNARGGGAGGANSTVGGALSGPGGGKGPGRRHDDGSDSVEGEEPRQVWVKRCVDASYCVWGGVPCFILLTGMSLGAARDVDVTHIRFRCVSLMWRVWMRPRRSCRRSW